MAVIVYSLGLDPARALALSASAVEAWRAKPTFSSPSVGLYSTVLNEWSIYPDSGNLAPATWVGDTIFARDTSATNDDAMRTLAQQALAINTTYLALASPSNAQVAAQVRALTREATGLIRLFLQQLDTTAGT